MKITDKKSILINTLKYLGITNILVKNDYIYFHILISSNLFRVRIEQEEEQFKVFFFSGIFFTKEFSSKKFLKKIKKRNKVNTFVSYGIDTDGEIYGTTSLSLSWNQRHSKECFRAILKEAIVEIEETWRKLFSF